MKGFLLVVTKRMAGRMRNWWTRIPTDTANTNMPSWEKVEPMSATLAMATAIRLATPTGVSLYHRKKKKEKRKKERKKKKKDCVKLYHKTRFLLLF